MLNVILIKHVRLCQTGNHAKIVTDCRNIFKTKINKLNNLRKIIYKNRKNKANYIKKIGNYMLLSSTIDKKQIELLNVLIKMSGIRSKDILNKVLNQLLRINFY